MDSDVLFADYNDVNLMCRCCLSQKGELKSLFVMDAIMNCLPSRIISQTLNVVVCDKDSLPSSICQECLEKIHLIYRFRAQVLDSYRILREHFQNANNATSANVIRTISDLFNQKFYDCTLCSKKFSTEFNLIRHKKICDMGFKTEKAVDTTEGNFLEHNLNSFITIDKIDDNLSMASLKDSTNNMQGVKSYPNKVKNVSTGLRKSKRTISKRKNNILVRYKKSLMFHKEIYICDHCDVCFKTKNHLEEHVKLLESVDKFACIFCCTELENKNELLNHIKAKHNLKKPYTCNDCLDTFTRWRALQVHIRCKHTKERIFACSKCPKTYLIKRDLNRHMKYHEPSFACNICEKKFKYRHTLKNHKLLHLGEKLHKCQECESSFYSRSLLKRHISLNHTGEIHHCPHCNKIFSHKSLLRRHQVNHTQQSDRRLQCSHCDKRFNHKQHLNVHERTHTPVKLFLCSLCGNGFNQRIHLTTHIKRNHGPDTYSCDDCLKSFSTLKRFERHRKTCQKDMTEEKNELDDVNTLILRETEGVKEESIVCAICLKTFSKLSQLKRHIRTHSKNNKFKCLMCNKNFATKSKLSLHLKSHGRVNKQKNEMSETNEEKSKSFLFQTGESTSKSCVDSKTCFNDSNVAIDLQYKSTLDSLARTTDERSNQENEIIPRTSDICRSDSVGNLNHSGVIINVLPDDSNAANKIIPFSVINKLVSSKKDTVIMSDNFSMNPVMNHVHVNNESMILLPQIVPFILQQSEPGQFLPI